jgi:hypothetical protein
VGIAAAATCEGVGIAAATGAGLPADGSTLGVCGRVLRTGDGVPIAPAPGVVC